MVEKIAWFPAMYMVTLRSLLPLKILLFFYWKCELSTGMLGLIKHHKHRCLVPLKMLHLGSFLAPLPYLTTPVDF